MKMLWLNYTLLSTLLYSSRIFCAAFSSQICLITIYHLLGNRSIIRHHGCNKKKFVGIYQNYFSCISKYFFLHAHLPGSIEDNIFQHLLHTDIVA